MGYGASKVKTSDVGEFTETVDWTLLNCNTVDGNNNKFFCIEIQKSPKGEFRIFTEYGRLGATNPLRDVRGPDTDETAIRKEYESIIKKKQKGKKQKLDDGSTYEEKYHKVDVLAPTVGSPNIRKAGSGPVSSTVSKSDHGHFMQVFQQANYAPDVRNLLTALLKENVHRITTATTMTVTSNGLETPLGPVTADHIDRAESYLKQLQDSLGSGDTLDPTARAVRDLNNAYFSLVPHPFGRKMEETDMILVSDKMDEEFDLLHQMRTALQVSTQDDTKSSVDIGLHMVEITGTPEGDTIHRQVDNTRKHSNLNSWKVKRVFEICSEKERKRYAGAAKYPGPEYDLFHGSRNSNILSILLNGFYIPPSNAGHVTGRMFGNGVYGASSSTKSLNYSTGYWGGKANQLDSSFLFLTRFAMGKVYECDSSHPRGAPAGYDSIHAKAGRQLVNDEYIVYNLDQTTVTYLIELKQR